MQREIIIQSNIAYQPLQELLIWAPITSPLKSSKLHSKIKWKQNFWGRRCFHWFFLPCWTRLFLCHCKVFLKWNLKSFYVFDSFRVLLFAPAIKSNFLLATRFHIIQISWIYDEYKSFTVSREKVYAWFLLCKLCDR